MIVIHLARKPLSEPSVAANVLKHGTGGLNVDGCRISTSGDNLGDPTRFDGADDHTRTEWHRPHMTLGTMSRKHAHAFEKMASGRWPANLILEHRKRGMQIVRLVSGLCMATTDAYFMIGQVGITQTLTAPKP